MDSIEFSKLHTSLKTKIMASTGLREDRRMLMTMHLCQLINVITAIGGFIVALILWQVKKDEIQDMDEQGKEVANFQISLIIYGIIGSILSMILIGYIILVGVYIIGIIFPILNSQKAKKGQPYTYPFTLTLIK